LPITLLTSFLIIPTQASNNANACQVEQIVSTTCTQPQCYAWLRTNKVSAWARSIALLAGLKAAVVDLNSDAVADAGIVDWTDPTSSADGWRRFHAPHMYRMGWLTAPHLQVRLKGLLF
jgi:hypothetical protein